MTPKPSLAETIAEAERRAFAAGAILPLESEAIDADDGQFQFQATWLSSLSMKDMAAAIAASGPAAANPFLPPEPDLVVTDLSPTHMIILNKFPLEPGHVMAISREFRQQQSLLDVEDWQAIATVLAEIDVLVMFNGGKPAGASQDHRHIHFMPGRKASLEPLFLDLAVSPDPQRVPAFNFPHVLVRLDGAAAIEAGAEPAALAEELDVAFRRAAQALGLKSGGPDQLSSSYNILMTRRWMLVVPRRENAFEGEGVRISLAAVHYGGLIMVREREQLEVVRKVGLHTILAAGAGLAA